MLQLGFIVSVLVRDESVAGDVSVRVSIGACAIVMVALAANRGRSTAGA